MVRAPSTGVKTIRGLLLVSVLFLFDGEIWFLYNFLIDSFVADYIERLMAFMLFIKFI